MASEASKTRGQAKVVSVVILVINVVCLGAVSYYLGHSLGSSLVVLENRSQQTKTNVTANLVATDDLEVDEALMQLSDSVIDFLRCTSSIPQLIGALMLFTATKMNKSPKKASEMVECHQKIQWFFLYLDLVRAFLILADQYEESKPIPLDCTLVFLGTTFFRIAGIFIVDRFAKELHATATLDNDAGALNLKV